MLSGPTRRLTLATLLLAVLLLAPAAMARPPVPNRDAPDATGGQEITAIGTDPTGRFAVAVVAYDSTKAVPGGLIPGATTNTHKDIFVCDLGPANAPRSGQACRAINHPEPGSGTAVAMSVDVTSFQGASGLTPVYAVGGPGDAFSYWFHSSDKARFVRHHANAVVTNVSVSPDGTRVVAGVAPTASGPGRLVVYSTEGDTKWELELTDSSGTQAARTTSMAFSRDGKLLVVGTTRGILFIDPLGAKPTSVKTLLGAIDTPTPVSAVAVSRNGNAAVAGTADGIFYVPLAGGKPIEGATWNRGVGEGVNDVAMSLDGERFAAASGNRILFYRHIEGPLVAEQLPRPYEAGARVNDLGYDATGSLLVALAGENVLGFAAHRHEPIWTLKATDPARGNLDLPLRKLTVSDTGERIVVAGRTKLMAYTNVVTATATFGTNAPLPIVPAKPYPVGFTLTNTGSLPDNYTFIVKAPVSWTATSPDNVALDPDGSAVVNLSVEAPAGTAPGVYPLTVEARSRAAGNAQVATAHLNLSLPRAIALALETVEEKVMLRQGGEETVSFTVRNLGNAEGVVNMTATQAVTGGVSWTARFSREQLRIPAGGSEQVDLVLTAPSEGTSGARNTLTIRAREGDAEAVRVVTAYVDAQFASEIVAANSSLEFRPGESRTLSVTLRNTGNTEDTYNVTYVVTPPSAASDWKVTLAEDLKVTLVAGGGRTLSVALRPAVAEPRDASLTLRAISQGSPGNAESSAVVVLTSRPADPTVPDDGGNPLPAPSPLVLLSLVAVAAVLLRRGGLR